MESTTDEVLDNRKYFLDFLAETEMTAMNTTFAKRPEYLATYMAPSNNPVGPPWIRPKYEQLDYGLAQHRWKNTVTDIQSYPLHNLSTDHFPLIMNIKIKLKKIPGTQEKRRNSLALNLLKKNNKKNIIKN